MTDRVVRFIREHPWFCISAASGILFLYVIAARLVPDAVETASLMKSAGNNRRRIEAAADWEKTVISLKREESELRSRIEPADSLSGGEGRMSGILAVLGRAAKNQGVRLTGIHPLETVQAGPCLEIQVRFSLTGKYHGLGRFVSALESGRPVAAIRRIKVESAGMASDAVRAEVELTFHCPAAP